MITISSDLGGIELFISFLHIVLWLFYTWFMCFILFVGYLFVLLFILNWWFSTLFLSLLKIHRSFFVEPFHPLPTFSTKGFFSFFFFSIVEYLDEAIGELNAILKKWPHTIHFFTPYTYNLYPYYLLSYKMAPKLSQGASKLK